MDEVAENSDALMERYLEGEEISHDEIVSALEDGTDHGAHLPGHLRRRDRAPGRQPAARRDRRRPARRRSSTAASTLDGHDARARPTSGEMFAYVFKTRADPFAGRINLFRVYQGTLSHDTHVLNTRAHSKERIGQLLVPQGKEVTHTDAFGPGDIGAVAKLKETRAGDWLADARPADHDALDQAPGAGHGVRDRAEGQGRRGQGLHRAAPPPGGGPDDRPAPRPADRRADRGRALADPRRGRSSTGCSSRFGAEVDAQAAARALPGDDPRLRQGPRPPQEADRRPRPVRRLPHRDRAAAPTATSSSSTRSRAASSRRLHPGGREGRAGGDAQGVVAGYPVKGVRVRLFDGSYHTVDSSEMAFKIAGSIAMKRGARERQPGAARADHARHRVGARRRASATSWATCPRAAAGRWAPRPSAA